MSTSAPLTFETLAPDAYDRAKKVLDRAKHPGFVGRETFFRCATRGKAVVAVLDGQDVGVALVSEADKLQALSVIVAAQGKGVGGSIMRELKPRYVSAIGEKTAWFAKLGYHASGAPRIGRDKMHTVQLMELGDGPPLEASVVPELATELQGSLDVLPDRPGLLDFIPLCGPWASPYHLADWVEYLERAPFGDLRLLCAVPIRHYKTTTAMCAIAWWLLRFPRLRIMYMSYSEHRVLHVGKKIRDLCDRMGVHPARGYDTILDWSNDAGGGVRCLSADQSNLGGDVDVLLWDDPIGTFAQADSPEHREKVDENIGLYTYRLQPRGSSIGIMSPMHPDDPLGRRLERKSPRWERIIHPAILDLDGPEERAWAPDVRTLEKLKADRVAEAERDPTERIFFSQTMCSPKYPGGSMFRPDPLRYSALPTYPGWRTFYGLDMAFSQAKYADYAAVVAFRAWGNKAFLLYAERFAYDAGLIQAKLHAVRELYGEGPIFSYISGPEIEAVRHLNAAGLPVAALHAGANKLWRSEKPRAWWNAGNVLVPDEAKFNAFVARCASFRGFEGDPDDEVDALTSALMGGMLWGDGTSPTGVIEPRDGGFLI